MNLGLKGLFKIILTYQKFDALTLLVWTKLFRHFFFIYNCMHFTLLGISGINTSLKRGTFSDRFTEYAESVKQGKRFSYANCQ